MAAMQNSRISLISKSDIRYEGTLFSINPEENTVALRNVRMLGTEDRRTGPGAVQGSEQTYEYIVFRGSDIKDLTVFEQVSQNQNMLPPDPAILSGAPAGRGGNFNQGQRNQGGNRPNFSQGQGQNRGGPLRMFDRDLSGGNRGDNRGDNRGGDRGGYGDRNRDRGYDNRDRGDRNVRSYDNRDRGYDNRRGDNRNDNRNDNRRGGYDNRRNDNRNDNRRGGDRGGRGFGGQGGLGGGQGGFGRNRNGNLHTGQNFQPSANPSNEYKEEFDFATANQSLDKDKLAEEFVSKATTAASPASGEQQETKAANAKSVYTPKNFFDELSCEALDAKQGTGSKPPDREAREAQKKNDVDTFGDAAMNVAGYGYGGRRRGMGRGRGRGGRGGRRY